jgi:hypothetical protein
MSHDLVVYNLGRQIYDFIKANPLVTRASLNLAFRTSSNDKMNDLVSEALRHMLSLGQVRKHLVADSNTVFFWVSSYTPEDRTLVADPVRSLVPNPIDILGSPPRPQTPVEYTPTMLLDTPFEIKSSAPKAQFEFSGTLAKIFDVFQSNPDKLFRTDDLAFKDCHPNPTVRGASIGRLAAFGAVRKGVQHGVPKKFSAMFTLNGTFPDNVVEQSEDGQKAELEKVLSNMTPTMPVVPVKQVIAPESALPLNQVRVDADVDEPEFGSPSYLVQDSLDPDEAEDEQEYEEAELADEDEDGQMLARPVATFSSEQEFKLFRQNGEVVEFDDEENLALIRLIKTLNISALKDLE